MFLITVILKDILCNGNYLKQKQILLFHNF